MADAAGWLTIESEPAVFHQLIEDLGVRGVQVEELYGLDSASIAAIEPLYGLIFLFRYQGNDRSQTAGGSYDDASNVWFARQVIQNACATQAILAVLLNNDHAIELGQELRQFREFTEHFDPETRGDVMSNSETLRTVHNSFARSEMFSLESTGPGDRDGEAPNHFIAYTVAQGRLYELDGLQPLPIDHGACSAQDFPTRIEAVLQERVRRYEGTESSFCLLALTRDVLADEADGMRAQAELERRAKWRQEVALRRHNFAGCIVAICRAMFASAKAPSIDEVLRRAAKGESSSTQG